MAGCLVTHTNSRQEKYSSPVISAPQAPFSERKNFREKIYFTAYGIFATYMLLCFIKSTTYLGTIWVKMSYINK
jgi:hypothetical protein